MATENETENYKSGHTLTLERISQRPYFEKHSMTVLQTASVSVTSCALLQKFMESTIIPSLRRKGRMKTCTHCNKEKYLTEFGITAVEVTPVDGLHRATQENTSDRCLDCLAEIIGKDFFNNDEDSQ